MGSSQLEIAASGSKPEQNWKRSLTEGEVVRIGRAPRDGWAIPWDDQVAPEHAELVLVKNRLKVRCLSDASTPLWIGEAQADECTLGVGDAFRIGKTTLQLVALSATVEKPAKPQHPTLKTLGKYQIVKKLGAGGMGLVYLAIDTEKKCKIALKVLDKDKSQVSMFVKRFQSEAQAAAQLNHKNIVGIHDSGTLNGLLFIALEYVQGIDVENLLEQRGHLSVKRSLDIIKQVTRALVHAHGKGIVHRDIKPSNLMITRDGTVKLTDMGLARSLDESADAGITRVGTTVGTVDYMAPEQARNSKAADARSDIYSLGCTWYHMLTGSPPYAGGSLTNKLHAHATLPAPDPHALNADVPEAMVAVLQRMMAKMPKDRYQTASELLADLENANLTHEAIARNILAALADDDDEAEDADEQMKPQRKPLPPKLPPRTTAAFAKSPTETRPAASASAAKKPPSPQKTDVICVACAQCGKTYRVASKAAGKKFHCKKCGTIIRVQ